MKTEIWNGHLIRFVEKDGEWWAVLNDVCNALNLRVDSVKLRLEDDTISNGVVTDTLNRKQEMIIVRFWKSSVQNGDLEETCLLIRQIRRQF